MSDNGSLSQQRGAAWMMIAIGLGALVYGIVKLEPGTIAIAVAVLIVFPLLLKFL